MAEHRLAEPLGEGFSIHRCRGDYVFSIRNLLWFVHNCLLKAGDNRLGAPAPPSGEKDMAISLTDPVPVSEFVDAA
jgi:hypothetical protein